MGWKPYLKSDQIGKGKDKKRKAKASSKQVVESEPKLAKITKVNEFLVNDLGVDSEADLFLILYKSGTKKSFLSGKKIYAPESRASSLFYGQFAHVLSKAKDRYPYFKLYSSNIIMLTNEEHMLLDHGTESQRKSYADKHGCDWNKIELLKLSLKREYKALTGE